MVYGEHCVMAFLKGLTGGLKGLAGGLHGPALPQRCPAPASPAPTFFSGRRQRLSAFKQPCLGWPASKLFHPPPPRPMNSGRSSYLLRHSVAFAGMHGTAPAAIRRHARHCPRRHSLPHLAMSPPFGTYLSQVRLRGAARWRGPEAPHIPPRARTGRKPCSCPAPCSRPPPALPCSHRSPLLCPALPCAPLPAPASLPCSCSALLLPCSHHSPLLLLSACLLALLPFSHSLRNLRGRSNHAVVLLHPSPTLLAVSTGTQRERQQFCFLTEQCRVGIRSGTTVGWSRGIMSCAAGRPTRCRSSSPPSATLRWAGAAAYKKNSRDPP